MRKMRDDSTWNQLTIEQREMLENWLFEENLGYAKTLERVQKEFGVEATVASLLAGFIVAAHANGRW